MSHSVVVPAWASTLTIPGASVGLAGATSGSETNPTWGVRIVDMHGVEQTSLSSGTNVAEVDTITYTLNQPDQCTFHFPKGAFTQTEVTTLGTVSGPLELQVHRNGGSPIFWGPVVAVDASGSKGRVDCTAQGVDWYLFRRFLDGPLTNVLTNGDFESGTGSWTNTGSGTFTIDTNTFEIGQQSAKLDCLSSGANYIKQDFTNTANGVGLLLTVSAWFYIDTFTASAGFGAGLYVEGNKAGVFQTSNSFPITSRTPRGVWTKASTTIWVPQNTVWNLEVRCYAIEGTIHWDDVKVVPMYSVAPVGTSGLTLLPKDIAYVIAFCIRHLQSTTAGKSSLNIQSHCETTGTNIMQVWQYSDHVQFDQALQELLDRNDGADYGMDYTNTTRVFHSYANRKGTTPGVLLQFDVADPAGSNCTDYRLKSDGGSCITRETVIGSDNGPDREEGEAVDASAIGGAILQEVKQAPQHSVPASLQPIADERLARFKSPPLTIELDVPGSAGLIPTLKTGDLVIVSINDGWTQVDDFMRIMSITLTPATNMQTVTVTQDHL